MSGISAVLIVKNEAARLAACLRALQEVADEIVVADTGSTDGTLEIARQFTPHCHTIPWEDDFAAARNRAITRASCPWILSIDADEVVDDPAGARVRLLEFARSQPEGTTGLLRHRSPTGTGSEQTLVHGDIERFFPRAGYVFAGVIHEQLVPVSGLHGGTASTGVTVSHSGYEYGHGDPEHKGRRNLPLLEKAVASEPGNEYYHYQLGKTLFALKRFADAAAAFERALALIRFENGVPAAGNGAPISREILTTLVTSLAYAYANTGRLKDAETLLSEHIAIGHAGTRRADFHHARGYIGLMLGDVERAKAGYMESMRCGPVREDVSGTGSHASAYHLGLLAEAEQDVAGAIGHYNTALEFKPDYRVTLDRYLDFMVEHKVGVAPGIQAHADPAAFAAACLDRIGARLDAGETGQADFLIRAIGLLASTNREFAGDLLDRCQAIRNGYGMG